MAELKHEFARVNGINMHYVTQGQGDLVVLLHGFPEFWYCWRHQIPVLAKHYKVVAPDLRGYNESDKPKGVEKYVVSELTKDIIELIAHLGCQKAHIVAHDWGGAIGWDLAINHGHLVDKLAILNSPHPKAFAWHLKNNWKQRMRSWYMAYFQIPFLPDLIMKLTLKKQMMDTLRGWCYNKDAFSDEDIEKYVEAFRQPGAITAAINYYRAAFSGLRRGEKPSNRLISVPTQIIWGENDRALGKELSENNQRFFDGPFEVKYIPNCSHWVQNEYPELVNEQLIGFLG